MLLLFGGEKGGTGKSTLATNIAAWLSNNGRDVLILDGDRQSTAANWVSERSQHKELAPVHCVQRYGNIFDAVKDLRTRYQDIVIDAGGRDSAELRSAMAISDVLYSPLRPSQSDLWTVAHISQLVGMAKGLNQKLVAFFLISMAPTHHRITETSDAVELLAEFDSIQLSSVVIRERKCYRDAMYSGRGVTELGDSKAKAEINELAEEIYGNGKIQSIQPAACVVG